MNNRRKLVIALGMGALTVPFGSIAQQQDRVWRVGFLASRSRPDTLDADSFGEFSRGMRELGYVDGKNLELEWRFAEGKPERLPGLATELVQLKVDVIVTAATPATLAAQKATTRIPIVMVGVGDPVGSGFVASLARPRSNITGLSNLTGELGPKQLEMLLAAVPKVSRVAVLINPTNPALANILKAVQAAAQKISVNILPVQARTPQEIDNAFPLMVRQNAVAVIVLPEPLYTQQKSQIAELAAKHRLPTIGGNAGYVEAGGLMSYGANILDYYRHAATYVDKILKGAKPGDLPVQQPTKFELFINGKTAKALGLKIPQSLLILADKIIE